MCDKGEQAEILSGCLKALGPDGHAVLKEQCFDFISAVKNKARAFRCTQTTPSDLGSALSLSAHRIPVHSIPLNLNVSRPSHQHSDEYGCHRVS